MQGVPITVCSKVCHREQTSLPSPMESFLSPFPCFLPSIHVDTMLTAILSSSDLLSRHVNKAHRTPEPGETKKEGKKGRRKSLPSSARKPSLTGDATAEVSGNGVRGEPMQAQTSATSSGSNQGQSQSQASAEAKERARRASFDYPHPPQLQAQRMYPNHPLLAGTPSPMPWNTPGVNGMVRSPVNTFDNAMLGTTVNSAGFHPGLASPVRWSGADLGAGASAAMTRNESSLTSSSYNEFGVKKRACDQCNHSKVRCDFAHPCSEFAQPAQNSIRGCFGHRLI